MTNPLDVYGIGNALVDIQAQVPEIFLSRLANEHNPGSTPITKSAMHLVDTAFQGHLLRLLEEYDLHTVSGGSAANTMIGLAHVGCRAAYAGKVGEDIYGAFYADDMHRIGVDFSVPFGHESTGTCIVLVTPDAQRTMFTHLGISAALTSDDIDEAAIRRAQWVYIEGYLWDSPGPRAASIKAMEVAKRHGVKVAYTFSDPFCVNRARDDFAAFTRDYVDLVFCNEHEAHAFAQTDCTETALQKIIALGTSVALTQGAKGSVIVQNGARHQIAPVLVDPIDTTGAGDLYAAGVLAGFCQQQSIDAAGAFGAALASQIITVRGARLPQETVALKLANGRV